MNDDLNTQCLEKTSCKKNNFRIKNGVRVTGMITDQIPGSRSLIETDNLSPMKAPGGNP